MTTVTGADVQETISEVQHEVSPAPCDCDASEHCDQSGECAPDVCSQGLTTCDINDGGLRICDDTGSSFEIVPCPEGEVCYGGECITTICDPLEPPTCAEGQIYQCNSVGTHKVLLPCPPGSECIDGGCSPMRANVIFLIDTSTSMNFIASSGIHAAACEGPECPTWSFPTCDDAWAPQTRLGKVKVALSQILGDPVMDHLRLVLQRFPVVAAQFLPEPDCNYSYFGDTTHLDGHEEAHALTAEELAADLWQILPVPFTAAGGTDTQGLYPWIDFHEEVIPTGDQCAKGKDCPQKICLEETCADHPNPEIRAMGQTPLGRSLFYAGEIFRHHVLVQGKVCEEDPDCGSPHHTCEDGRCHDPFSACRPNAVVIFSDGQETRDMNPNQFFHPRIQAKRLRYGLGCETDADCAGGATCQGSVCTSDELTVAETTCRWTGAPCQSGPDCPPYPCAEPEGCADICEHMGLDAVDLEGENVLRDHGGNPVSVTVHVANADGDTKGGAHIAAMGGGQYVQVTYEDVSALVANLLPILDLKASPGCD